MSWEGVGVCYLDWCRLELAAQREEPRNCGGGGDRIEGKVRSPDEADRGPARETRRCEVGAAAEGSEANGLALYRRL